MRRVREVLRLRTAGVGLNEIARRAGVAPSTVRLTLKRLTGLSWPLPAEMTDAALEATLFAAAGTSRIADQRRSAEDEKTADIDIPLLRDAAEALSASYQAQARHPGDAVG